MPNSVKVICDAIENQLVNYEKDLKRLYMELSQRQDKTLVDALLTSFGLGFSKDIDLKELNLVCLLHLMKAVLEKFSSPLFTFPLTIHSTSTPPKQLDLLCISYFPFLF